MLQKQTKSQWIRPQRFIFLFMIHVQHLLAGEQCSSWVTERPPMMTSNSNVCHHHCRRGEKRDMWCVALEGFCLTPDCGKQCLSLPRRKRNKIFENSLYDHSTPHSSTLMIMRLWGSKRILPLRGPGRESPVQLLVLHTMHLIHGVSLLRT